MSIDLRHSFVVSAVMLAACDFTGLPEDRSRYTSGPHRDAGASVDATTGGDACVAESDGALTQSLCGARVCGTVQGDDNCGASRSVSCGVCGASQACSAAGACDCAGETTPQLVSANCGVGSCGDKVVTDRCGGSRTINCGSTCAGTGQTCGGGDPGVATANVCGCTPESALAFCTRYGKDCGSITAADNCGNLRSAVACGSCTAPQTCAGAGVPNVCGCMPTSCAALGANCDSVGDGCGGTLSCGPTSPSRSTRNREWGRHKGTSAHEVLTGERMRVKTMCTRPEATFDRCLFFLSGPAGSRGAPMGSLRRSRAPTARA